MEFKIKETGKIEELVIKDSNNIEWTADLIGNVEGLNCPEGSDAPVMSQQSFEWWSEYIKNYEADEKEATELAEELDIEESLIWERYNDYPTCDYSDHHAIKQQVFAEIKKEHTA